MATSSCKSLTASCCVRRISPFMARRCVKTGKQTATGHKRSHSLRATNRTFRANIQKKRVWDPNTGEYKTIKVAASYLRTLAKRLQEGKRIS